MTHISDHFPQFIILNKININYKNCSYAKHDFSKFNEQAFINTFAEQNLNFVHGKNLSLNFKFDEFYQSLSSHVDNHAPPKKMNKKDLKLHEKPWVTLKIQELIKYRDKLLQKLNRKFTEASEYLYKKFRNRVVSELKSNRINYYNNYFTEHNSSKKMLWNGIKSIINLKGKNL